VAYYANELSINEMKPGDWLVAPCHYPTTTGAFKRQHLHAPVIH